MVPNTRHKYMWENKNMTEKQCKSCKHTCHCAGECSACSCTTCTCDKQQQTDIVQTTVYSPNWSYHF